MKSKAQEQHKPILIYTHFSIIIPNINNFNYLIKRQKLTHKYEIKIHISVFYIKYILS